MKNSTQSSADRLFSIYIRLRDSDENGYGRCISCGKIVHWKDADAGHFVNRKHLNLRYDEMNVNLQCRSCNRFDEGNSAGYTQGLIKKYGENIIEVLRVKKSFIKKYSPFDYGVLCEYFKNKIKRIKKSKRN